MQKSISLPGKLGDESQTLLTDPRLDPRLHGLFRAMELPEGSAPGEIPTSVEHIVEALSEMEKIQTQMLNVMTDGVAEVDNVLRSESTTIDEQGQEIKLFIHRPKNQNKALPCIYHMHGGGMAIFRAEDKFNALLRDRIAELGFVVIGVEFRNSAGALGPFPFPAGLNDCFSGLRWLGKNKKDLNVSKIILAGESGGANLALGTCLKSKQENSLELVDGVYVMCPFIDNSASTSEPTLVSKTENSDYYLQDAVMAAIAISYDPKSENSNNPLCWPYEAAVDELSTLPPHVISVNELDPLRDEGLQYFRKLMAAGVQARSRTVNGTSHAADLMFPNVIPDVFHATLKDMQLFANSL